MEKIYDKQLEIINASIYLFSKKGFASTSVQDIATHCNMSKATIYKVFSSKEEILIHLIKHVNKQMFTSVESLNLELGNNGAVTLEKKLTLFFEHLYKRKNFSLMIYENQSLLKNPKFESVILQNRTFVLNWYRSILLDAFGEKIKPILWDLVLTTTGMIKEFNYIFIIKETISHDFEEVSKFIVKALVAIIDCHYKDKPLVPPDLFDFFENKMTIDKPLLLQEWTTKVSKIKIILDDAKNFCNKSDVFDALLELTNEVKKEHPRKFLIDSLFLYLGKYKLIETEVIFLKSLYMKVEL